MTKAVFDAERCKGCGLCLAACPKKIVAIAGHTNQKGYAPAGCTDEAACTGCTLCAVTCPDMVIEVFKEERAANG
jgi:2-oxoglutarate ferredoxin oxidoreductase subunit delta